MKERIVTGICLIFIVLICLFSKLVFPMLSLMTILAGVAAYEWFKLMPYQEKLQQKNRKKRDVLVAVFYAFLTSLVAFGFLFSLLFFISGQLLFSSIFPLILIGIALFWLLSFYWVLKYPNKTGCWYNFILYPLGPILISCAAISMFILWTVSPWWLMYLFLLVWGADSGAYFVGRKLGRTKLSPEVSPNKSVEGLFGGVLTAVLIMFGAIFVSDIQLNWQQVISFVVISIVTVLASVQGDLFESMIKRRAGIKDSGRILPGHGGVLDRVDSLLAAAPVFLLGLYVLIEMGVNI